MRFRILRLLWTASLLALVFVPWVLAPGTGGEVWRWIHCMLATAVLVGTYLHVS